VLAPGHLWTALPVVTAPLAVARIKQLAAASDGSSFNRSLAGTAQLLLVHGALFAVGLAM